MDLSIHALSAAWQLCMFLHLKIFVWFTFILNEFLQLTYFCASLRMSYCIFVQIVKKLREVVIR